MHVGRGGAAAKGGEGHSVDHEQREIRALRPGAGAAPGAFRLLAELRRSGVHAEGRRFTAVAGREKVCHGAQSSVPRGQKTSGPLKAWRC